MLQRLKCLIGLADRWMVRRDAVRRIGCLLLLAGAAVPASSQDLDTGHLESVPARTLSYRTELRGYARVAPIGVTTVEAGADGVIEGLAVRPGQPLSAGEVIAHLAGPDQMKARTDAEAQLSAAQQTLAQASDTEQAVSDTYRRKLSDRAQLDQAKVRLASAQAGLTEAKAGLERVQALSRIPAPVSGQVMSLAAANGDRVSAETPIVVIQPDHDLWLKAVFYEVPTGLLTPGRAARFLPADGSAELSVRFAQQLPSLRPDGGLTAFFEAASSKPGWSGGEAGEVVVTGEPRPAVAVPTVALILDRSRWWVLVESAGGLRRQRVEPGPSRGEQTLILKGLAAGETVVVRDAYRLFHRDFGQQYTPPD